MKIKNIYCFSNGAIVVFDDKGQQVPKYQENWICKKINEMFKDNVITDETKLYINAKEEKIMDYIYIKD
jgi:hypothetical protein